MTATPRPVWQPAPTRPGLGAGRIVGLVLGVLLLLLSGVLLLGGGVLLAADLNERSADGYLLSGEETLAGPGHALVSERIDLSTGADWVPLSAALGTARFEVTGTDPGTETFIGIATVADATAYLDGVSRTVIDDLGIDSPGRRDVPGGEPSGPPADQDFWTAQSSGSGTQQMSWVPTDGDWMLVVMNADGSAGVSVDARIGATVPALDGLAWGLLVSGIVCALIAVLLLVLALRRPYDRRGPVQPAVWPAPAGPQPAGPPPWAAPTAVDWPPSAPPAPRTAPPSETSTRSEPTP